MHHALRRCQSPGSRITQRFGDSQGPASNLGRNRPAMAGDLCGPLGELCLGMGCEEVWRVIVGWDGNMFFVHVFFPTKIGVDSPWGVDLGDSFGAWVLDADMVFQLPIGSLRTGGPALHWGELGKSKVSELFARLSRDSHGDRGRQCEGVGWWHGLKKSWCSCLGLPW